MKAHVDADTWFFATGTKARRRVRRPNSDEIKLLERFGCNDCGLNVVLIGEFYMLSPEIWNVQLGPGWTDNLCIGCLEKRLGRKVSSSDMGVMPNYWWMQPESLRLMHRRFGAAVTKRPPYRWKKSTHLSGLPKTLARRIGEYAANEAILTSPPRHDIHRLSSG
jgi:hypothetical protein